jgi:hypothetical protein
MSACGDSRENDRIEQLERRLRRQTRILTVGFAMAVAASLLLAQAPSKRIVEAEEFILRGPQGQELAKLDGSGTGAVLSLYDSQHRVRIALTSADVGNLKGIAAFRSNGQVGAKFGVEDNDNSSLELRDARGSAVALLQLSGEGPSFILTDNDMRPPRAVLVVHNEVAGFSLQDEKGRQRTSLELTDMGPKLRFWDANGVGRAGIGIDSSNVPVISVTTGSDPKEGSVVIASDEKGGGVLITDANGNSRNVIR